MIGHNIKKIRQAKKLGLNATARKAGISASYLSSLETGLKKNPSTALLNNIAIALNVSLDELVKDDCSDVHVSEDISVNDCITFQENLLKTECSHDNKILYTHTINLLKEINELKAFKNKILNVINE